MKKSRAILLLIALVVVLAGYVAWAAWEPAPTIQSMIFMSGGLDERSAAEADFRSHPPKGRKLTWPRFLNRLAYPYRPREKLSIPVWTTSSTGHDYVLLIHYPRERVYLAPRAKDGRWVRVGTDVPTL